MTDLRTVLEQVLDEIPEEQIRNLVREAFEMQKTKEIWVPITCKHCQRDGKYVTNVPIPDFRERYKAIEMLLNQGKGRPKETVKVEVDMTAKIEQMTLAELDLEEQRLLDSHPELRS